MPRVGQSRKRDKNEPEIVQALRDLGLTVYRISAPGVPDLLVHDPRAIRGPSWLPLEVKQKHGKFTGLQKYELMESRVPVVRSVEDAIALYSEQYLWPSQ